MSGKQSLCQHLSITAWYPECGRSGNEEIDSAHSQSTCNLVRIGRHINEWLQYSVMNAVGDC